ncbi:MAG: amidohydrolase family protein [Acidobacteriota bacterium]|nr:amidohydrolase family protein [Acidobacteriota bacterium]
MIADAHCHFFSSHLLELLSEPVKDLPSEGRAAAVASRLGWSDPGDPAALAAVWIDALDRHSVSRAALIASVPGDESSVAEAVRLHPDRFVGFFMFNPGAAGADERIERAFAELHLRCVCLFPAMHRYRLDEARVASVFESAARHGAVVFVHCGVLSVGVRGKLGLPSPFDLRLGDPLALAAVAAAYPSVPVIVPHFGAGRFQDALMAADACPSIHFDSSSSNGWMKYYPGLTLDAVFRQTLAVVGPRRLLFGTDSSFFPRGWQRPVLDAQLAAMTAAGVADADRELILAGNFNRLFTP